MTKRIVSLMFTLLFFAVCLVPTVGLMITGGAKAGANEILAGKPSLQKRDGTPNGEYLSDLAAYIGDRFFLRQEAVTAWAKLNASLLHTSVTEDVLLGRDGRLYFAPTLGDYTRTAPMTERELWCAARTLYLLQESVEKQGCQFLFTVAPNKNSLYTAAMPDYPVANSPSNAEALRVYLAEMGVNYLDLFAVFENESEVLYFPADSHWNGRGAALAADAILRSLGREGSWFSGPFTTSTHKGDLYEMLYPAGKGTDADYVYAPGFTFTANSSNPDNARITAESPGEGALRMYRDSFGRNLYPYLAESFAASEFSRKTNYDPTDLPEGGALVIELVERNLRYLNTYAPTLPAPERNGAESRNAAPRGELVVSIRDGAVSGSFGELKPDDASPVYVSCGGRVYEAVPQPDGFTARLPEGADDFEVIFTSQGELVSLRGVME